MHMGTTNHRSNYGWSRYLLPQLPGSHTHHAMNSTPQRSSIIAWPVFKHRFCPRLAKKTHTSIYLWINKAFNIQTFLYIPFDKSISHSWATRQNLIIVIKAMQQKKLCSNQPCYHATNINSIHVFLPVTSSSPGKSKTSNAHLMKTGICNF